MRVHASPRVHAVATKRLMLTWGPGWAWGMGTMMAMVTCGPGWQWSHGDQDGCGHMGTRMDVVTWGPGLEWRRWGRGLMRAVVTTADAHAV